MARWLIGFAAVFLNALCFAADTGNSINAFILPDPVTHCQQLGVEVAMSRNITLGIMPADCNNRPTFGRMESQVTNTFRRVLFPLKYYPQGAFTDGYFFQAVVGVEESKFRTASGSSANVRFVDTGFHVGYQWFWQNGFNVSAVIGIAHLEQSSLSKSIAVTESASISDYLDQQTRTNTHTGIGVSLGWAF